MEKIDKFDGEYSFLSNFYDAPVWYEGLLYQNNEAAFQAAKNVADDNDVRRELSLSNKPYDKTSQHYRDIKKEVMTAEMRMPYTSMHPSEAKRNGRHCKLRPDWEEVKYDVMHQIVMNKFYGNKELAQKLIDTGDAVLIEGNTWNDTTWGVCKGKGENHLGKILMSVRDCLNGKLHL